MCRARKIPNAVELRGAEANCQKCIDKADLAKGMPSHRLSITALRDDDEQRIGDTATCSCENWTDQVLNSPDARLAGGVGPMIVTHHYAHVIAAVRAARTYAEQIRGGQ